MNTTPNGYLLPWTPAEQQPSKELLNDNEPSCRVYNENGELEFAIVRI